RGVFPPERLVDGGQRCRRHDGLGGTPARQKDFPGRIQRFRNDADGDVMHSDAAAANGYAQQTADTLATDRKRQLAQMIRLGWLWTFILWAVAALIVLAFQNHIIERWELTGSATLWV